MISNRKAVIWVIISTVVILGLISLVKMGNIIFIIPLFFYFSRELQMYTGMDAWLAKAIVILLVIPFFFSIKEAISLKKEKRTRGVIIFSALAAICFLGLYTEGKAHFFDFKTGEAVKYYAETPEGFRFFDEYGFDPKYGTELRPATKEIVEKYLKEKKHNPPEPTKIMKMFERKEREKNKIESSLYPMDNLNWPKLRIKRGNTETIIPKKGIWTPWIIPENPNWSYKLSGKTKVLFQDGEEFWDEPGKKNNFRKEKGVGMSFLGEEEIKIIGMNSYPGLRTGAFFDILYFK